MRFVSFLVGLALVIALVFSYTRAAWVSIAIAVVVYLIFAFRIKFYTVLLTTDSAGDFIFLFQNADHDEAGKKPPAIFN